MEPVHTPNIGSIEAVCAFLKTEPADMIKTLIYTAPGVLAESKKSVVREAAKRDGRRAMSGEPVEYQVIAALVRGDHDVNEEKLRLAVADSVELAEPEDIKLVTGAEVGFAGPVGFAVGPHRILIDHAVAAMAVGVTGANRTDYHVKNVVPGRDFPLKGENVLVTDLRYAVNGDTCSGKKLLFRRGIEVGQVFKLGTKYSEKLGAKFLDENGVEQPCTMGCYGIGINRIVASAVETGSDANGIIWPISIAPFEVLVTCVNQEAPEVADVAEDTYKQLLDEGADVLLDDRGARGGVKFKDADLIGVPVRVTVGKKSVAQGKVEIKLRSERQGQKVDIEKATQKTLELVDLLKAKLNR